MEPDAQELASLVIEIERWEDDVARTKDLFQRNVYDNPNADRLDYVYHRMFLASRIAEGDQLTIRLATIGLEEAQPQMERVASTVAALSALFVQWHAPSPHDDDVPAEFDEGMKQALGGVLEPMA